MTRALLMAMAAGTLFAQTISVSIGGKTWTWNSTPTIIDLKCNRTTLAINEIDVCTVTIDFPAPTSPGGAGFQLPSLTCSANAQCTPSSLVVPPGQTTTTFQVKRLN